MVSFSPAYLVVFDSDMLIYLRISFVGFFFEALNEVGFLREDLHLILLGALFKKLIFVFYVSVGLPLRS